MLSFFERYHSSQVLPCTVLAYHNLIEHAWFHFYDNSGQITLTLMTALGPEKGMSRLTEIPPLCWEDIPPKQFEALLRSMPDRLQTHRSEGMVRWLLVVLRVFCGLILFSLLRVFL